MYSHTKSTTPAMMLMMTATATVAAAAATAVEGEKNDILLVWEENTYRLKATTKLYYTV